MPTKPDPETAADNLADAVANAVAEGRDPSRDRHVQLYEADVAAAAAEADTPPPAA